MGVKTLGSGLTTLRALEAIGREQPIGVSALARTLGITKSSAQRVLATLDEAGWIGDDGSGQARWQLTDNLTNAEGHASSILGVSVSGFGSFSMPVAL